MQEEKIKMPAKRNVREGQGAADCLGGGESADFQAGLTTKPIKPNQILIGLFLKLFLGLCNIEPDDFLPRKCLIKRDCITYMWMALCIS